MNDPEDKATRPFRPPLDLDVPFTGSARVDWVDAKGPHSFVIDRRVVVGSSPHADIVVDEPTVSRVHAELEPMETGIRIRDLQSKNGTRLQGVRIEAALTDHVQRIRFGQCEVVLRNVGKGSKAPPESWPHDSFGPLLGGSTKMRALYAMLSRIAPSDAPVLITGETGTGKEVVARAIHEASNRSKGPFVIVDCAALPESLLDAELFGHAKGAFTGALGARAGAIESANGGTVFLDEIGELPKGVQPKLLRVLEAKTVRRIGENDHRAVDVRFVGATHRDLLKMVSLGEFREDLFFRLSVLCVALPALRERLDDLDVLVRHFLGGVPTVDPEVLHELHERSWPGNVRELRNFVDRLRTLGLERALEMTGRQSSNSAAMIATEGALRTFRDAWIDQGERVYLTSLLARHQRNVVAAAREAEVDRTHFYKLMRKHGIE